MSQNAVALLDAVERCIDTNGVVTDRRSVSRAISLVEDGDSEMRDALSARFSKTGGSTIYGVTGSPGAGKSTLVDVMAQEFAKQGKSVAVLAVDPSSPFSGGALLGDRIRMTSASTSDHIYIRSLATRGALGGLSHSTREIVFLLELAGFDIILLETVGVGQAEVDIVKTADIVCLVLVPGMGDGVQALKAGIIEIADIFVVNKSDYQGSDRLVKELRHVLSLAPEAETEVEIIKTVASRAEGVEDLLGAADRYFASATQSGELEKRRTAFLLQAFRDALKVAVVDDLLLAAENKPLRSELEGKVCSRKLSPNKAAKQLLDSISK